MSETKRITHNSDEFTVQFVMVGGADSVRVFIKDRKLIRTMSPVKQIFGEDMVCRMGVGKNWRYRVRNLRSKFRNVWSESWNEI